MVLILNQNYTRTFIFPFHPQILYAENSKFESVDSEETPKSFFVQAMKFMSNVENNGYISKQLFIWP